MKQTELTINWNPGKILALGFSIIWISLQISIPLFWLIERGFDPKPRQFGWQMYTNMAGGDRFQAVYPDSSTADIDIDRYVHNVRPALTYGDNFLDYLCQKFPEAKQTQRRSVGTKLPQIYQCPD